MDWYDHGVGPWAYGLMVVGTVVFWGLVILSIIALIRYLTSASARAHRGAAGAAEQVLAERFARGEIDEDEYHRRLDTLRGGRRGPPRSGPAPSGA
ncbi:SHOCT domain-containing protein [Goodfellowiella coeruleoviolacea]|uniref:Membrane protein n=1 Tax=Goodfellowiella coeruleoviolacea TaxID=334858 RepID=A0AAE3GK15_9PSEU|nr:SHOCT domain-containing protein [Goodfellowiella coeruleoviolacea]MCP2167593.1 putative membrane protein [Goodfellowiella coeruleoviolacea]